jgi:hypothetical protein
VRETQRGSSKDETPASSRLNAILDSLKKLLAVKRWHHRCTILKRIMDMKCAREFLLLTGLLISACSQPDLQTAELQRIYAKKGEEMTPTINKVERGNPQRATTPHLSTTNAPVQN